MRMLQLKVPPVVVTLLFAGWIWLVARTTVHPLRPDAATALVTNGIYRFTRNPMYLGLLLALFGWALLLGQPAALLLAVAYVPVMNRLQIIPEEHALRARFGAAFHDYQARVRRWL